MKSKRIILIMVLSLFLLVGCQDENKEEPVVEEEEVVEITKDMVNLELNPNELGQVMVLMYHNIGEEEAEWTRTPENFKKDLNVLKEEGYVAVSLEDYVNDNIDVPAGKTPVVITFDDGNENNFRVEKLENGDFKIDPNSAIGILEEFNKENPEFQGTATFFVLGKTPFGDKESVEFKLNYLKENGYSIGNHTTDHRNMSDVATKEGVQEALARQVDYINDIIPEYDVNTYALCYGARPKNEELHPYLVKGEYEGTSYNNIAIVNVGWDPAKSPLDVEFDETSIPRIRASEMKVDNVGLYDWLDYFENNPEKRYISDGYKEIISIPKELEDKLDSEKIEGRELNLY